MLEENDEEIRQTPYISWIAEREKRLTSSNFG